MKTFLLYIIPTLAFILPACAESPVDYPIVAIKSERLADNWDTKYPDVFRPHAHPPSNIVRINPDGTEEVILDGITSGDAYLDPVTRDGVNLFYAKIPNTYVRHAQRYDAPKSGADIFSINLDTKEITQWTDQTEAPLPGVFDDPTKNHFGYGVFNLGPCPLPDGRLVYSSSRRRLAATASYTGPCMQLHVRHLDGTVECIGPLSQGSALHPVLMRDGRIMYSSYESMGFRDRRSWSLWHIDPDGSDWGPLFSIYSEVAIHFHTQRSDGKVAAVSYYNNNNDGFGQLLEVDEYPAFGLPEVGVKVQSGWYTDGKRRSNSYVFAPSGLRTLTPWSHERDEASILKSSVPKNIEGKPGIGFSTVDGDRLGKVTHPMAAPDNAILMTFSGGPVNRLKRPTHLPAPHMQIRILKSDTAQGPDDLLLIKSEPGWNYSQPIALVSHQAIYGQPAVAKPDEVDHSKDFGIFGSADAFVGQWQEVVTASGQTQGLDSGGQGPPTSLVVIGLEPNFAQTSSIDSKGRRSSSGKTGWDNGIDERMRIMGEYFFDQPGRPEGDKSFRVKVPADVPFTVAIRGTDGRFLTCGQSWKQVRPGMSETKCGGCHNHAGSAIPTDGKFAFSPGYHVRDFTRTYVIPEFHTNVEPIFAERCVSCHSVGGQASLVLDSSIAKSKYVMPLRAGKSLLSQHIRGENGLDRMPLGEDPLSAEQIRVIEEWIDLGALVDIDGSAFDVRTQPQGVLVDKLEPAPTPEPEPEPVPNVSSRYVFVVYVDAVEFDSFLSEQQATRVVARKKMDHPELVVTYEKLLEIRVRE